MHRRQFTRLLGAGAAVTAAPAIIRPARAQEPLKVGFIYLGPVGDFGWTYQHDIARKACEAKFGGKIKTTYVENVPEGPDSEKVLNDLANQGHKLVFATSFGYMNYVLNSAKKHPKVFYEHATGYKRAANVATYNIRFYQGRYVQGVIAGKLSKAGIAGYVGSIPVPEVVQGMNAFMLGMRSVNPKAVLKFVMINSWYDPPKEGDAAKALMDQGCDIITQHTDSPAPLQAAAARGIKAFGQSTDMAKFAEGTQLSASTDVWAPYYIKRIQAVMDGTWKSTDTWGGFAEGMLQMSPFTNMPDDVAKLAGATVEDIKSGKNKVFVGPISDQAGAVKVPAGTVMDDAALGSMQWLVQGIDGKLT
ncbi:MAG TPA: BMP family ABC transporter substrate-binding protein [Rhodopila sp.]|uniref:BMP family ABC transporter substrate-binding protein n=1 Tax=Rhodopila sp. TaxID=2480087 RepID=UPI002D1487D6|nr:BMP family ABC transporter substrate-binding protein [Rhodopila sp.]HVY16652.1 BMP family ABC transporter substrate-binding protein [Rhodopila sp.]